ncbi:MAG TPA: 50S ribosomal protein L4 [Candidatus Kapabacteria bacterium]|nr:50S ribosomal protein L4 [Candidatus Kapabacteria bacterium]
MLVDIYSKDGQKTGEIELQDKIFAVEPNEHAMHLAVVSYLANQRQGTHKTKTRAEVSGGGKKPWRQKGRGTARSGSSRSPVWVGGGTIHGPKPHKYSVKLTKKMRQLAKLSALTCRMQEDNIKIVEDFNFDEIKTKNFVNILKNLQINNDKTLVLLPKYDLNLYMSARNIPKLSIYPIDKISTYDILNHKKLLFFKGAIETLENIILK